MQVKATDEVLKGVYANMVQVGHTPEEFILDFMNMFPPTGIITSQGNCFARAHKAHCRGLGRNIKALRRRSSAP